MNLEDLLADETFVCGLREGKIVLTPEIEKQLLQDPANMELLETALTLYPAIFKTVAQADMEAEENRLRSKIFNEQKDTPVLQMLGAGQHKKIINHWALKVAAASAILILGCYFFLSKPGEKPQPNMAQNVKSFMAIDGEKKKLQLPDGTVVTLNSGSKINIDKGYGIKNRDVDLSGEAFFDVMHNAEIPFIVHCSDMDVKALGTAFNVQAYPGEDHTEASLVRGKIEVTLLKDNNRKVILHPDQKVEWRKLKGISNQAVGKVRRAEKTVSMELVKPLTKTITGDTKEIAWTDSKLIFDDESFGNIAVMLEHWYGVKVFFDSESLKAYRFTANFEKEKLDAVLNYLKESKKFNYEITYGNITSVKISK